MAAHSEIGPSSADRWFACPGSVEASRGKKDTSSIYAVEGTVAHDLCEKLLTGAIDELDLMGMIGTVVQKDGYDIEITEEMVDAVLLYAKVIAGFKEEIERPGNLAEFGYHIEGKVVVSSISKDLWGTADCILYQKGETLYVIDFKYGKGHAVEVKENKQMAIYGVGAQDTFAGTDFKKVVLVVVQPRAPHKDGPVRTWEVPEAWLAAFREELVMAVIAVDDKDAPRVAGEEQCRWCRAKSSCPAIHEAQQKQAEVDFAMVETETNSPPAIKEMTPLLMAQAMTWEKGMKSWFEALRTRAQEMLEAGEEVPGYKLVKSRSNRKYAEDAEKVIMKEFTDMFAPEDLIEPGKLLSPAKLEKVIGKSEMKKLEADGTVFKPEGKNSVALDSDPRDVAAASVESDFKDVEMVDAAPSEAKSIWPGN